MSLTTAQVKHIARLSRLELTDEEVQKFGSQLSAVLGYIEKLDELDTTTIGPTVNTTGIVDRMREDQKKESLSMAAATNNSNHTSNGFFVVPNVFE